MKETLTKKIGPLPAWGWAVAVGGSLLLFRFVTGRTGQPSKVETTAAVPVGSVIPGSESSLLDNASASDLATLRDALVPYLPAGPVGPAGPAGPAGPIGTVQPVAGSQTATPVTTTSASTPPTGTAKISRADAASITRSLGLDPAKVFGYGTNQPGGNWWVNTSSADYVWASTDTFRAWLRRTYGV